MALVLGDDVDNGRSSNEPLDRSSAEPGRRALVPTVVVVASYLILGVALYWGAWSAGWTTHMQAGGDQFGTVWFLRWIPFALAHGHNPFFTDYGNYPFGVNLLTNTSVPLLGLLGTPVTLAFGPIATFNALCTIATAGSATAGYLFMRRWTTWRPAAWTGGLLYGFSPYEIAQSNGGHLNLTFVVFPPLILLTIHELVIGRRGKASTWGLLLGLLVVGQFFVSSEVLASTLVIGTICVVTAAVIGHRSVRSQARRAVVGGAWALSTATVLLAYPVWLALRGPGHINGPIQLVPQAYRADLLGPLVPNAYTWLAPSGLVRVADAFANSTAENGSYLGITLVITVVVGIVVLWRRSMVIRVATIGGAAAFILSLGGALVVHGTPGAVVHGLPLPERLFTTLPLLSNTVPVRYSVYVALFAGLVLAIILDRLRTSLAGRSTRSTRAAHRRARSTGMASVASVALAVVCLLPLVPDLPIGSFGAVTTPGYFTSSTLATTVPGQVTVLYPYPSSAFPIGQLWQAMAAFHFKSPGGYFLVPDGPRQTIGFSPNVSYGADTLTARVFTLVGQGHPPVETPTLRAAMLTQFHSWHVTSLVADVNQATGSDGGPQFLTWLVGRPPTVEDGVDAWHGMPTVG